MEKSQKRKLNIWMIVAIIFMVLTIACGVAAVLAYINMPDKEQIAADAKTEAETAYNEKVSELKSYYESKIKTIEAEKSKAIKEATGEGMSEEYDGKWDTLNTISTVNATTAKDYIYLPIVGKKVKISSSLKGVKYLSDNEGVLIWAVDAEAGKDSYDFADPDKNTSGMIRLEALSKKYIDAYLKIDSTDDWMNSFSSNSIVSGNGNLLRRGVASLDQYSSPDSADGKVESKTMEILRKLLTDKENYEDL